MSADSFSFDNLLKSHKKCRLSKQHKTEVIRFEINLGINLVKLSNDLASGKYNVGRYKEFMVYDPKKRLIEALSYRDRIVQMTLCRQVLEPALEPKLIYDNAACRKGKGTLFSVNRLQSFLFNYYLSNERKADGYALKCDIAKYFASINHGILFRQLNKCGFDEQSMSLIQKVISSRNAETGVGLPLGNQTSQWFALLYLNGLDHFIKEKLRIKYYIRYMDDFVLIHNSKDYLKHCKSEIDKFLAGKLELKLNAKTQITRLKDGIDFLGFRHILTDTGKVVRLLRQQYKLGLKRKLKKLGYLKARAMVDDNYVLQRVNAYKAHVKRSRSKGFVARQLTLRGLPF
ncbi:MAG: reverse transcriptase/maturase family protein [Firmicutes bacterium]|nr:reverse transcriptase/maturase family protein [Bacillota bacterium]